MTTQLRAVLEPLAAYYFLKARTAKGRLIDFVARFHLGNGARLERINWLGDLSPKGLREFAGIMVNYLYRLVVLLDVFETIKIIDHDAGGFAQGFRRNIAEPVDALQPRAVAEMNRATGSISRPFGRPRL